MAAYYTPLGGAGEYKHEDFLENFIHPEDYSTYVTHINSLGEDEVKEMFLKLKNKQGGWSKFCFRNRLYKGLPKQKEPYVLSLAYEVSDEGEGQEAIILGGKNVGNNSMGMDFKHFVGSLDEGFCEVDLLFDKNRQPVDFLFIETNRAFESQIPYKNATGKTLREVNPASNSQFKFLREVAETGTSKRFELFLEELNALWLEIYAFRMREEHSNRVGMIFTNVTRRKKAEEELEKAKVELEKAKAALEKKAVLRESALRESEELLKTVFDTTNQAIAVFDTLYHEDGSIRDFKFLKVNKILMEMYLEKDPTGHSYKKTSKHGVEMGMYDSLKKVMETGEPMDNEFYYDREGYNHWFRVTARSQNNLLIAAIEDISQRKAQEEELQESLKFRQELGRASQETILIINLSKFIVRYINRDLFPAAGITKERVEGMHLVEILPFIHPRDREDLLVLHKKLLKSSSDEVHETELRVKLKENSWEWFNVRGKVFFRRDASWVEEYVLLITNITIQKNTEKALLNAEKHSIKGEIARTIAHELRNPIASIGMVGEVLSSKINLYEKEGLHKYFNILSRSTQRLNSLVTDLLTSSNYSPVVLKKEDLAKIVTYTVEKASDRIYLAGIQLELDLKGPYLVMADKEKLEIALLNILVNASEATNPGEGVIKIEIIEEKTDFILTITDNGKGMEQEQIDRLFEAFYTNKPTGLGIGLSSVKTILEDHEAKIKVLSRPGIGSTFKILFTKAEDSLE